LDVPASIYITGANKGTLGIAPQIAPSPARKIPPEGQTEDDTHQLTLHAAHGADHCPLKLEAMDALKALAQVGLNTGRVL
jgi:hypothetical protein